MCTKNMKLPQLFLLYAVFSITTPVRNRLGTEKAHKLVQIFRHFRKWGFSNSWFTSLRVTPWMDMWYLVILKGTVIFFIIILVVFQGKFLSLMLSFIQHKHDDLLSFSQIENKLPGGFCEFFMSLHSCPTSSGAIEWMFSTFALVWSAVRNRLGTENAD